MLFRSLPAMGLLISKQASSGTLVGDMDMLADGGLATALGGQETAMAMLRLDGLCFAEVSEDGIKRMRALSDEEEAYINPRK